MRRLSPRILAAALLVVGGIVWSRVNRAFEGRVLVVFTPDHGLTVGDLPSLAAFAVAVWLVLTRKTR